MTDESVTFSVTSNDGDTFAPPYVGEVRTTAVENTTRQADLCGQTETSVTGTAPWQLEVKGQLLPADLAVLKRLRLQGKEVLITNDIETGSYVIEDVEITQSDEKVTGEYPNRPVTPATKQAADSLETSDGLYTGKVFDFRLMTEDPSQKNN